MRIAVAAARADDAPTPARLLTRHLGPEAPSLPVVGEGWANYDHVNVQVALDRWTGAPDRRTMLVGLTDFQHSMFTLADLAQPAMSMHGPGVGAVAMARLASGPNGATRPCVRCGLYLVSEADARLALLFREAAAFRGQDQVTVEVLCADADRAAGVLSEIRGLAVQHSVFRGQLLSFGSEMFGPHEGAPLVFHERPMLRRESLVLPVDVLEAVEAQVVGIARHRSRLVASGQHLKRGVLLHGPPGTGKTHTLRYLIGRVADATVVMLSGDALQFIAEAVSIARALQPALVIVEDVDLIAEERDMPGQHPLLFELLNEIDGLAEDTDVAFLLTTNRADLLEPALAQRPGRVDQAVELPLPDADSRRALLALYKGNLELELADTESIVGRTEGVTASFFKELLRRAALVSAEHADGDERDALTVGDAELQAALDQLLAQRNQLTRVLLGARNPLQEH